LGLGAALGLYRISRQRAGLWLDAALIVLAAAFIGARAAYALLNLAYFSAHPLQVLEVWRGGLAAPGAMLGGGLGLLLASVLERTPVLRLADWLYPLIPPLAVGAWLGSWLVGVAYGPQLPAGTWWGVSAVDESGLIALRAPLQLGAAVALAVFYWLMETLTPLPRPSGWLFSLAATWVVLISLVTSLLRVDPMPLWRDLRMDTLAYLIVFVPYYGLFSWLNFVARKKPKGPVLSV
jgi:phosphatidylglycerol:prolipoprotein diacylglycerol transferase